VVGGKILEAKYKVSCELSSVQEAVKSGPERVKLKNLLLEAVATERLVKAQSAGKGLVSAVVIPKVWRLAIAL
jgi:hypothetical protein